MRPGESGTTASLALVPNGGTIFPEIHSVLFDGIGERGRQRLHRRLLALIRDAHIQTAQIDAGVARQQHAENGLRHQAEGEKLSIALKQVYSVRGAGCDLVEALVEALVRVGRETLVGFLLDQSVAKEFVVSKQVLSG